MKKVILVDMENMQHGGYLGLEHLDSTFEIVFFESEYAVQVPDYFLKVLDQRGIGYTHEWCERNRLNKDTMDLCMVMYLGFRANLRMGTEVYYVLSKDSDFEIPSKYLSKKANITILLAKSTEDILYNNNLKERVITTEEIIEACLKQATSKQHLHCLLQKSLKFTYKSSVIGTIYRENVHKLTREIYLNNVCYTVSI